MYPHVCTVHMYIEEGFCHSLSLRDGSAVEIVGLCKSAVRWLAKLYNKGAYPYSGVSMTKNGGNGSPKKHLSFAEWNKLIYQSFEAKFWIPEDPEEGARKEGSDSGYIHRRGVYKDSCNATQRYADFQLRPNFPIAMVVVSLYVGKGTIRFAQQVLSTTCS